MQSRGLLKNYNYIFALSQKVLDVILIMLILFISAEYYDRPWDEPITLILAFCTVALFLFFSNLVDLYASWRTRNMWAEVQLLFVSLFCTALCLLFLGYITKTSSEFSRLTLGSWWLGLSISLLFLRILMRKFLHQLRSKGYNSRLIAIAGSGELARELVTEITHNEWMGFQIAGHFDDISNLSSQSKSSKPAAILGDFNDLVRAARNNKFDAIYVALPMQQEDQITQLIKELSDSSVEVHLVPDLFTFNLINSSTSSIGRIPTVSVYQSPLDEYDRFVKRIEDIVITCLILLVATIPMLIIALLIKLSSSGPVIFKQHRYGLGGKHITVLKFRTMKVPEKNEEGDRVVQAKKGDDRITKLGAILRKTSLDELPQFFNVLQGSMSIVGPRPHAVAHNELYRKNIDSYMQRHLMKPGITGWAQINGWRGETDDEEKMKKRIEFDLHYLRHWSLMFDLKIILTTLFSGFTDENAY